MPQEYWWIWGVYQGRYVALGPYSFEDEARKEGHRRIPGWFDVVELPTRDVAMATRMLKARQLQSGSDLGDVLRPVRHVISDGQSD